MKHLQANYHTHTFRCGHASGRDREYVENAVRAGIATLGFSDHAPMVFHSDHYSGFRMQQDAVAGYFESLVSLQREYEKDIRILIGVEAEYYPEVFEEFLALLAPYPLDYMILGQHFLWREEDDVRAFAETKDPAILRSYYENLLAAAATGRFMYIAHPDVLRYTGETAPYLALTADFLEKYRQFNMPLEINRLGFFDGRHYPRREFWELAGNFGIPAVIGLDAHSPDVLLDEATVDACLSFAAACGVTVVDGLL